MNARYSPIAPPRLLHDLVGRDLTTGYYLMLAHDVLEEREHYEIIADFIRAKYGEDTFIIMDNSVVELGHPVEFDRVVEAAHVVGANCVMTPDVLGSFKRTQDVVLRNLDQLHDCPFPLMRVPQGASIDELFECVDWTRQMLPATAGGPEYWGIPRWVTNKLGSRQPVAGYITLEPQARVHLLGMSKSLEDDLDCTRLEGVMGIDSANPMVMGHLGKTFDAPYKHYDRGDYWDRTAVNQYIIANAMYMNKNVGYPQT